jgi:hypothetical protein
MICVVVEKVQRTLVNWAATCEFEHRQMVASAQTLTQVHLLPLCHFCHMRALTQHLSVSCSWAEYNGVLAAPGMFLSQVPTWATFRSKHAISAQARERGMKLECALVHILVNNVQ